MRFGAVIYLTVRFGAVSEIVNATVRFGAVFRCRRCGSVIFYDLRRGSVRFSDIIVKPTTRRGAVFRRAKILRCGAVRLNAPNRTDPIGKTAP